MTEHADLAAWVMGELDADAARRFEAHLLGCERCRLDAAELEGLPELLRRAAPPFDVPPELEARVLGALRNGHRRPRRRLLRRPRFALAGAATLAAAAALAIAVLGGGAPTGERLTLRSTRGESVDVTATVRVTPVGREVTLDIRQLDDPRPDGLYELWFVAHGDTRRRPDRVSAGTFHPDEAGRGTVRLLAAADPKRFPDLSVTLEPADGNPRRTGPEVLRP